MLSKKVLTYKNTKKDEKELFKALKRHLRNFFAWVCLKSIWRTTREGKLKFVHSENASRAFVNGHKLMRLHFPTPEMYLNLSFGRSESAFPHISPFVPLESWLNIWNWCSRAVSVSISIVLTLLERRKSNYFLSLLLLSHVKGIKVRLSRIM